MSYDDCSVQSPLSNNKHVTYSILTTTFINEETEVQKCLQSRIQ